jgi:hypothetical protein
MVNTRSGPRIAEILKRHVNELCRSLYTEEKRHCLLGWMAVEAGVKLPPMRYNTHVVGMAGTGRFVEQLQAAYGLTLDQLKQLQFANDDATDITELLEAIKELSQSHESGEMAALATSPPHALEGALA